MLSNGNELPDALNSPLLTLLLSTVPESFITQDKNRPRKHFKQSRSLLVDFALIEVLRSCIALTVVFGHPA